MSFYEGGPGLELTLFNSLISGSTALAKKNGENHFYQRTAGSCYGQLYTRRHEIVTHEQWHLNSGIGNTQRSINDRLEIQLSVFTYSRERKRARQKKRKKGDPSTWRQGCPRWRTDIYYFKGIAAFSPLLGPNLVGPHCVKGGQVITTLCM